MTEYILAGVAIFAAVTSAIGLILTSKRNLDSENENRKIRIAEILERIDKDLFIASQKRLSLKNTEDCEKYSSEILHVLERICFQYENGIISRLIIDRNLATLSYGMTLIKWKKTMSKRYSPYWFPSFLSFVEKEKIEEEEIETLPNLMIELYNDMGKHRTDTSSYKNNPKS